MHSPFRRRFLRGASSAGLVLSADLALGRMARGAGDAGSVRIWIDSERTTATLDPNLFGSFLEHAGRAIYGGVYEPGSKLADARGFRTDVLAEVRRLGVPIIRYPGGSFVTGYHWLDGVGPPAKRPRVLEKAWNSIETNQFGTDEFMAWCRAAGTKPLMAVNLGTGTPEQAAALVEYCNVESGTRWSELRREYGHREPYGIRHWCLGNELDGPWEIGQMSAADYGMKAADAARQMRDVDPKVQLVACGSSSTGLPTYLDWDREVLERCYDHVDALSLHRYFGNTPEQTGGDSTRYVALNLLMDRQIEAAKDVCDVVRAKRRSPKQLWLSFDEWNVWYRANRGDAVNGRRQVAPHLLEESFNLEDALVVGGCLLTLLRHADRVRIGCLAQLVNVIAPIMTSATGLLRQTIYYPYAWALRHARGAVLELLIQSPGYEAGPLGEVPYVDAAATMSPDGAAAVLILNRDLERARAVELIWENRVPGRVTTSQVLTGNDLKATNTFEAPERVRPEPLEAPITRGGRTRFDVPARSFTVVQWAG